MVLIILFLLASTFYGPFIGLDAKTCQKGYRVTKNRKGESCQACPGESFQPTENESQVCHPCTRCDEESGSFTTQRCTKETDAKCQCRGNFVPWEVDSSTCKCDIGFGLTNGDCSKCKDGYFSNEINSPCKKWKTCRSGVKNPGTSTTDVVCKESTSISEITTPGVTRLTDQRPQEETNTQNLHITTTNTTTHPEHTVTTEQKGNTIPPGNTGNHTGTILLMLGIAALILLTAVTCKLHITPCVQKKTELQTEDSLCRRPVEESGDDSLTLKLNPGP